RDRREANRPDLVVTNGVGEGGMGTEEYRVIILGQKGIVAEVTGKKRLIAKKVVDALEGVLG
ncbi:MAG: DNA/pantothenate metabolism flavoprotein, partial [Methanothrix sp.]